MKISLCFISLIAICILPNIYSQDSPKVPGPISCSYFAGIQNLCNTSDIPVSSLPQDCMSFVYKDIRVKSDFTMDFATPSQTNDVYIQDLISTGKSVFLYVGRADEKAWIDTLTAYSEDGGADAQTEMTNLQSFIEPYNISGIIIKGLVISPDTPSDLALADNLKIYIDTMKSTFPNYGIGLEVTGTRLIDFFDQENPPEYMNLSVVDECIDFYVINAQQGNICADEFQVGGGFPVTGDAPYTLEKVNEYVQQVGISPDKTIWAFMASPNALGEDGSPCETNFATVCLAPTLDGFCAGNTQSFFDQGAFAAANGIGFIAMDVDLRDDPNGCCKCASGPYPAFHSMMAGFNGDPIPENCTLFDKPS